MANLDSSPQARTEGGNRFSAPRPVQGANECAERIADWVMENVPWTVAAEEWPGFHERWPLLTRAEVAEVERELCRRGAALDAPDADLEAIAKKLTGRSACYKAAADWLTLNPAASISEPQFFRQFGRLSRSELILAAIEHRRRVLQQC